MKRPGSRTLSAYFYTGDDHQRIGRMRTKGYLANETLSMSGLLRACWLLEADYKLAVVPAHIEEQPAPEWRAKVWEVDEEDE